MILGHHTRALFISLFISVCVCHLQEEVQRTPQLHEKQRHPAVCFTNTRADELNACLVKLLGRFNISYVNQNSQTIHSVLSVLLLIMMPSIRVCPHSILGILKIMFMIKTLKLSKNYFSYLPLNKYFNQNVR